MNQNTSAFIGLGAIGTLIAYFGYQYLDDEQSENEESVITDNVQTLYNDETKEAVSDNSIVEQSSNSFEDISNNTIKLEVSAQINKKVKEKQDTEKDKMLEHEPSKWSNYWEGEYNNIDKTQELIVE